MCTCIKVEDACCLPLHSDGYIVPLYVGSADASVRQLNLKETAAALHAVQSHVIETRFYVRLVGIKGLVKNVLHDLDSQTKTNVTYFSHKCTIKSLGTTHSSLSELVHETTVGTAKFCLLRTLLFILGEKFILPTTITIYNKSM